MTDALKHLATDPDVDRRVKKKLNFVLGSWHEQYKDDSNMHFVAGILKHSHGTKVVAVKDSVSQKSPPPEKDKIPQEVQRKREKVDRSKKEKQKRVPFNFETVIVYLLIKKVVWSSEMQSRRKNQKLWKALFRDPRRLVISSMQSW